MYVQPEKKNIRKLLWNSRDFFQENLSGKAVNETNRERKIITSLKYTENRGYYGEDIPVQLTLLENFKR